MAGPDGFVPQTMPLPPLDPPGSGDVHAWYLDLNQLGGPLRQALAGEDPDAEGSLTAGQRRFARRFYLRLLLGAYLGIAGKDVALTRSLRGKPVIDRSVHRTDLQFSMAKSEGRVMIGISSEAPIGVDLEPSDRRPHNAMRVARRYFHPDEAEDLAALPADQHDAAFLRAWACKEAVVKASGQGIANQLCRFRIEMDPCRPAALYDIDGDDPGKWRLALVQPDRRFVGAIAVRQERLRLTGYRLVPAG